MTDSQRGLAAQTFNAAWNLIDKSERTSEEERQMLTLACASRALWEGIGGAEQKVTGDWQVAHVASLLGHASLALEFANAAYEEASTSDVPTWLLASTCEGLARAHATAGHVDETADLDRTRSGVVSDCRRRRRSRGGRGPTSVDSQRAVRQSRRYCRGDGSASRIASNLVCDSLSSAPGSEPETMPQPASMRTVRSSR